MVVRTESDPLGFVAAIKETVQKVRQRSADRKHQTDDRYPRAIGRPVALQHAAPRRLRRTRTSPRRGRNLRGHFLLGRATPARSRHSHGARGAAAHVLALIVKQGMRPALLGLVAGIFAAAGLTRFMRSLLFQVSANHPLVFIGVALVLALVAGPPAFFPPAAPPISIRSSLSDPNEPNE